jgi:hypothetical protein
MLIANVCVKKISTGTAQSLTALIRSMKGGIHPLKCLLH